MEFLFERCPSPVGFVRCSCSQVFPTLSCSGVCRLVPAHLRGVGLQRTLCCCVPLILVAVPDKIGMSCIMPSKTACCYKNVTPSRRRLAADRPFHLSFLIRWQPLSSTDLRSRRAESLVAIQCRRTRNHDFPNKPPKRLPPVPPPPPSPLLLASRSIHSVRNFLLLMSSTFVTLVSSCGSCLSNAIKVGIEVICSDRCQYARHQKVVKATKKPRGRKT